MDDFVICHIPHGMCGLKLTMELRPYQVEAVTSLTGCVD